MALTKMGLTDWTKTKSVKYLIKEIAEMVGVDVEPTVAPTRRIYGIALERTIPAISTSKYIVDRTLFLLSLELAGGMRVGEATGGGEYHGLLANNINVATPLGSVDPADETIEAYLEDSKMKFDRYVAYFSVTRGPLKLNSGRYLRELWKSNGLVLITSVIDGLRVTKPDYFVVRVSLLGLTKTPEDDGRGGKTRSLQDLITALSKTREPVVAAHAKTSIHTAKSRFISKTHGEPMRYVNIAGGARHGVEVERAVAWAKEVGFGSFTNVVPGPLLRATDGNGSRLTHMPLQPRSTYAHLTNALVKAYHISRAMSEPDPELDLMGRDPEEDPSFGNHGNRRKSDRIARETAEVTGATEGMIDDQYGWDQAARRKKQQLHYAGRIDRARRAKVTMMI